MQTTVVYGIITSIASFMLLYLLNGIPSHYRAHAILTNRSHEKSVRLEVTGKKQWHKRRD